MKKVKFMDLELFVPENVFTPRPETELLVNVALYALASMGLDKQGSKVLDVGTGSGNVAISLTKLNKNCKLITLDIDERALEVAKTNAHLNGVSGRIEFVQSNLFGGLSEKLLIGGFDVIVSNPPYVAGWEMPTLSDMVQREPRIAIDGGDDGLTFYRKISTKAPCYLKQGGYLIMEIGYNQLPYVTRLLEEKSAFTDFEIFKDNSGIDRVIMAKRPGLNK